MINITTIKELYTKDVPTIYHYQPISEALDILDTLRASAIVIINKAKEPLGILTERDITTHAGHWDEIIVSPVSEIMSAPVSTIDEEYDFRRAYMHMTENGFRHLVVLKKDGSLAGILDEGHFLRHLTPQQLLAVKEIKLVMSKNISYVKPTESVAQTIKKMTKIKVSSIVIVSNKKPVGIFTERDSIRLVRQGDKVLKAPISEHMTSPVKTMNENSSVIDAEHMLRNEHIRHLIAVDENGELTGILSQHDLVKGISGIYVKMLRDTIRKQSDILCDTFNRLEDHSVLNNILNSFSEKLIIACDLNNTIEFTNAALFQCLYKIPHKGKKLNEDVHCFDDDVAQLILSGNVTSLINKEATVCDVEGNNYYFKTSYAPIYSDDKILQGLLFTAEDITSVREQSLKEKSLKNTLDNATKLSQVGTWEWDSIRDITLWNKISYDIFGVKENTKINIALIESLIHKDDIQKHRDTITKCFQEHCEIHFEYRIIKNNEIRIIRAIGNPIVQDGEVISLSGAVQDITNLKKEEYKLNEAQKIAKIGSWEQTHKNESLTWSDEVYRIFEISHKDNFSFDRFMQRVHPDDHEKMYINFQKSIQEHTPYFLEHRLLFEDGRIKYVIENAQHFYDNKNNHIRTLGTVQDVTQLIEKDRQLEEKNLLLQEREHQLLQAQKIAKIGNWSLDIQTMKAYWSEEIKEIFDIAADSVVGPQYLSSVVCPTDWPTLEESLLNAAKNGKPHHVEYRIKRQSDGAIRWVDCRGARIINEDGKAIKLVGTLQDITTKKEEELKTLEKETLFRAMFEQAAVGVAQIDSTTGQFIKVNQTYADIVGLSIEEMLHIDFMKITHPDEIEEDLSNMQRLRDGKTKKFFMRKRYYKPNKDIVWVNLHVSALNWKDNQLKTHIAIVQDVTQQILYEQQMQFQSELLEQSLAATDIVDEKGNFAYVNNAYIQMWGYDTKEEILNTSASGHCLDSNIPKKIIDAINDKGEQLFQFEALKKDGSTFDAWMAVKHLKIMDKTFYLGSTLDVSELRAKEEMLFIQSRQAAMGEMINMIAHQWRQPLSVISMTINSLLLDIQIDKLNTEVFTDDLSNMNDQIQYMSTTIDDFRNFFKRSKTLQKDTALHILEEVVGIIRPALENKGIEITIECDSSITMATYKSELKQVFINILSNAKDVLENMQDKKIIKIAVTSQKQQITFKFFNNGDTIPLEMLNKIFDPYFSTKESTGGSGLGLYMSQSIIEKHMQGSIKAENTYNGVTFIVEVPQKVKEAKNE